MESVTPNMADLKVSDTSPSSSKAAAEPSTSAPSTSAPSTSKQEEDEQEETAEEKAQREAELQKIHADLAKEDDRCLICNTEHAYEYTICSLYNTYGIHDTAKKVTIFCQCFAQCSICEEPSWAHI